MRFLHTVTALILLFALALPTLAADDTKPRTWTDATGVFSVVATLVEVKDGKVHLKKADGKVITVAVDKLSSADQDYVSSLDKVAVGSSQQNVSLAKLTGKPEELKNDDGKAEGRKSFPRGIASAFKASGEGCYLTSIRIHGGRYGQIRAPKEDFHVTLCDKEFKEIADFEFAYSKFERGNPKWVTLRCKPTKVPQDFVICLNFAPTGTKGVYVSHDKDGKSLVGLPGKPAGSFTGGDWMLRVAIDKLKPTK